MRYLLLWEQTEKTLFDQLYRLRSPESLRSAMHHFRISRSFPGIGDQSAASFIFDAVDSTNSSVPSENVERLAELFETRFGSFNLSAASKLLWLKHRAPYLILDARAVLGLRNLGFEARNRRYDDYSKAWRNAYSTFFQEIDAAVSSLTHLQPFLATWHSSKSSITELTEDGWFKERVFDIALWEHGID